MWICLYYKMDGDQLHSPTAKREKFKLSCYVTVA